MRPWLVLLTTAGLAVAAVGQASPLAPDEGKQTFRLHAADRARLHAVCGERPEHYPPADPDPPYDVTRYEMVLDLDPARRHVGASTGITATVLHDSLDSIALEHCGRQVLRVVEIGAPTLRPFRREGDQLIVTLSRTRRRGESFTVVVDDSGTTGRGPGIYWAPPEYPESPATFTFSEPQDARTWFPCNDEPNDKATLSMLIAVPGDHVVAANGRLDADYFAQDGRRVFWWVEDEPIATYLVGFAAAPYAVLHDDRLPGIPIANYVYRPDSASARRSFDRVPDMIRHFSTLFGDYPFEKYGHAAALFPGGMEHQTMTLITERATRDSASYQQLIAHELVHQWFGDSVTPTDWRHLWLNEGFATYGDALWYEHLYGPDSLRSRMALFGSFYKQSYFLGLSVPVVDPPADYLFGQATYNKGAWVLHMLRHIVGDRAFFDILRAHHAEHRHGNAETDDFVATAERVAGRALRWYFDPWLYGAGLPRYRWDWAAEPLAGGMSLVRLTVTQAQDTTFYPMPVDFSFRTGAGERLETVFIDRNPQTFSVILDGAPLVDGVAFDPGGWILSTSERVATAPGPAMSARLTGVRAISQPGAPPLELEATLAAGEPIPLRAEILDLQGRHVSTVHDGLAATGTLRMAWNGRSESGNARPGVYFARVTASGDVQTVRLILIQ